jgi:hypothetical protein
MEKAMTRERDNPKMPARNAFSLKALTANQKVKSVMTENRLKRKQNIFIDSWQPAIASLQHSYDNGNK